MVQTDLSQLTTECSEWRQILRNYRDEFGENKKLLQELCSQSLSKDQLQDVEHYQNQFHIQLINIHDLKQQIKNHERRLQPEQTGDSQSDEIYSQHENLLDDFVNLESTLQELRYHFKDFISKISC
jgi:chromosome segregation ATPase